MKARLFIMIVLGGFLFFISLQNMHSVSFNFITTERSMPLIILIYLILFVGFVIGFLYCMISSPSSKHIRDEKRAKRELQKLNRQHKKEQKMEREAEKKLIAEQKEKK